MKEVSLTLRERLAISRYLPQKGNKELVRFIIDLETKLVFKKDEIEECGIGANNGSFVWRKEKETLIEFSQEEFEYIAERLKEAESTEQLHKDDLLLFNKFVK